MLSEKRVRLIGFYAKAKQGLMKKDSSSVSDAMNELLALKSEIDPNDEEIYLMYGALMVIYAQQGKKEEAKKFYHLLDRMLGKFKAKGSGFKDLYSDTLKMHAWIFSKKISSGSPEDKVRQKTLLTDVVNSEHADKPAKEWAAGELSKYEGKDNETVGEEAADSKAQYSPPVALSTINKERMKRLEELAEKLSCVDEKGVKALMERQSKDKDFFQAADSAMAVIRGGLLPLISQLNEAHSVDTLQKVRAAFARFCSEQCHAELGTATNLEKLFCLTLIIKFFENIGQVFKDKGAQFGAPKKFSLYLFNVSRNERENSSVPDKAFQTKINLSDDIKRLKAEQGKVMVALAAEEKALANGLASAIEGWESGVMVRPIPSVVGFDVSGLVRNFLRFAVESCRGTLKSNPPQKRM